RSSLRPGKISLARGEWPTVPVTNRAVIVGRDEKVAVRTERHQANATSMSAEGDDLETRPRVPNHDRQVRSGGRDSPSVRTERQTWDRAAVPTRGQPLLSSSDVPDSHAAVDAAGRQASAVKAESRGQWPRLKTDTSNLFPVAGVPLP